MNRSVVALSATVAAGALIVAAPAGAAPAPTSPSLQRAAATGAQATLIVHVTGPVGPAIHEAGLKARHSLAAVHAFSVRVPSADAAATTARLRDLPDVTSVERAVPRYYAGAPTNDPLFATKQATYLDAINAPAAWARQHGSATVKIAVVDSGVDVTHPDLVHKIAGAYNADSPSSPMTDEVGHGTFVAGVAAADTNNNLGVAGAGYATNILAVKIADPSGAIEIDDEVAGINWAVAHGATVINLSFGGPDPSAAEQSAIAHAQAKGVLVVAAAGNDGDGGPQYPAGYPGVVAVGATDVAHHTRADFSDHASWVTVAAPGVAITSTAPANSQIWGPQKTGYATGDGTSFSSPLVAGEAALLKAQNPAMSANQLRRAIIASAHGYAHLGLGAGQVDFARGLAHVVPTTVPSALQVSGTAGRLRLTATSSALAVAFRVDNGPLLTPVRVVHGAAAGTFASWGYANGPHTLHAYDCTAYGECSGHPANVSFPLANPASAITAPSAGATVTGLVHVRATNPAGGPLRLLLDGHAAATRTTAPYDFPVSTSYLSDGHHTLATQACSTDGRLCRGPVSPRVTVDARGLHPRITALTPAHISPNGDHVRDTGVLSYTLPQAEQVRVLVLDGRGTVVRSAPLGRQSAGRHTWVWRGRHGNGQRVPDGRYTIVLDTSAGARGGWVTTTSVVDTRRPRMTHPTGSNALFYPARDGYRDTFTTRTTLSEPGRLTLVVQDAHGHAVASVSANHLAGPAAISWTGHDRHGARVPAGTYRWQLVLTDYAGNVGHTGHYAVRVSAKRLVTETRYVAHSGGAFDSAGGTDHCAFARASTSAFAAGLDLVNGCSASSFDLAYANYTFHVPSAYRYVSVAFEALGRSRHAPSELSVALQNVDGTIEIPRYEKTGSALRWYLIASVPAAGHITRYRHVYTSLLLDSFYPGRNDFDVAQVRLRVRLIVLR